MSMNIYIYAERKITFKKKDGKNGESIQYNEFRALQTPTRVTYEILESNDPVQTYIDWVIAECSCDEIMPVFAEDDILQVGEPVGTEIWNSGKEHVEKFRAWIKDVEENGYTVKFEIS